uniref:Putative secreted protein n=1 Tax=Ixodes ricinus TaxID=34613 RepID=A0A147BT37_IXORI
MVPYTPYGSWFVGLCTVLVSSAETEVSQGQKVWVPLQEIITSQTYVYYTEFQCSAKNNYLFLKPNFGEFIQATSSSNFLTKYFYVPLCKYVFCGTRFIYLKKNLL